MKILLVILLLLAAPARAGTMWCLTYGEGRTFAAAYARVNSDVIVEMLEWHGGDARRFMSIADIRDNGVADHIILFRMVTGGSAYAVGSTRTNEMCISPDFTFSRRRTEEIMARFYERKGA